ncbi:MFS transporter [Aliikangiella maris]|uniref:MFS transporter n=2 Tax=Aliikangiella maris TaxID=3162458 RepID=A0ABV2BYY3_9GAMM
MSLTFVVTFVALILIAISGRVFVQLPKNIWILFFAMPMGMASSSMVVFASGIIASKIAPSPELATLPITLMIVGTALAVIPATLMMNWFGRRKGTMIGFAIALVGALMLVYATLQAAFAALIIGSCLLGFSIAFVAQMRFAALESLIDSADAPKAISVLMVGGIFAAVIGPEMAVMGKYWVDSPHGFAGSFIGLAALQVIALIALSLLDPIGVKEKLATGPARSFWQIVKQPIFLIAVAAGAIGYSVMSYIMTATPLSMHEVEGHSLESTKWVIQSHIVAMYLPSLFSAVLTRYLGLAKLMILGSLIYLSIVFIALDGREVMHYWWALVLLGLGWNFLYTSGTLLLPSAYHNSERFKAQATNDFTIFTVQALGSLSAGVIIFSQGWDWLVWIVVPFILLMLIISIWYFLLSKKISR